MNKFNFKNNVAISFLEDDAVILDMDNGKYIHVNGTAASICKILNSNSPKTLDEICKFILNEYQSSQNLQNEISDFIDKLIKIDLIKIC